MAKEASYTAWTSSKNGTSPLVALLIFANYEITGFLVSGESSSVNGVDVHLLDLFWTSAMVLALLASNFVLRKRPVRTFPMNLTAWALSSVFAATTNGLAASAISGKPLPTSYQLELLGGVVSMFASCLLFTLIVSGFTEGRSLQKKLRSAQSELLATRSTFVARLDDYAKQLSEPVQKLVSQLTARAEPLLKTHVRAAEVTKLISAVLDRDLREVLQDLDSKRGEPSRAGSGKTKLDSSLKPLRRLPWAHSPTELMQLRSQFLAHGKAPVDCQTLSGSPHESPRMPGKSQQISPDLGRPSCRGLPPLRSLRPARHCLAPA